MIVLKDFLMSICGALTVTSVGLGIYYGIKHGSKNEENNEKIDINNGKDENKQSQSDSKESEDRSDDLNSSRLQPLIPEAPVFDTSSSENETLVVKK